MGIGAVVMLVALNAVFVLSEFALIAVDRSRIERLTDDGSRRAATVDRVLRRMSFHLSGAQLGVTVISLVLGFVAEPTIGRAIQPLAEQAGWSDGVVDATTVIAALVLATVAQMVLGELIPKGIALARPTSSVLFVGPILRWWTLALRPLIHLLDSTANKVVRAMGIEPRDELRSVRTLAELGVLIQQSADQLELASEEVTLLSRAIDFATLTAVDALVPRVDLVAVPATASADELVAKAKESGKSRLPVFGEDLDDVLGFVHVKDVLSVPRERRGLVTAGELAKPALVVPETRELDALLADLRARGRQIALVVDEHGGTAGIITIEDIVEQIVGDIADEYDAEPDAHAATASADVIPGQAHADEVRTRSGFEMPEGSYETLAGFVLSSLGHIPVAGERFEYDGWALQVLELDGLRISSVRVQRVESSGVQGGEPG